jgi:hypothetical protein
MDEQLMKEIKWTDEERDEAIKDMSMDEALAYTKSFYQRIMDDPEILATRPPGSMERLKAQIDLFEKALAVSKIADRNAEIAQQEAEMAKARFDRAANDALRRMPPDSNGN